MSLHAYLINQITNSAQLTLPDYFCINLNLEITKDTILYGKILPLWENNYSDWREIDSGNNFIRKFEYLKIRMYN